jgi:hemerythrin superfamily protein
MGKGKAKIKGAAKQVGSMMSGESGIINSLKKEHGEVASLMDEVADDSASASKRAKLFAEIRKKLIVHSKGEELELYPECRKHPELRTLADESVDDHDQVERLIVELDRLEVDSPLWLDTFIELKTSVEQHVELEENELFPKMERLMDDDHLREMASGYKARKKSLMERVPTIEPRTTA